MFVNATRDIFATFERRFRSSHINEHVRASFDVNEFVDEFENHNEKQYLWDNLNRRVWTKHKSISTHRAILIKTLNYLVIMMMSNNVSTWMTSWSKHNSNVFSELINRIWIHCSKKINWHRNRVVKIDAISIEFEIRQIRFKFSLRNTIINESQILRQYWIAQISYYDKNQKFCFNSLWFQYCEKFTRIDNWTSSRARLQKLKLTEFCRESTYSHCQNLTLIWVFSHRFLLRILLFTRYSIYIIVNRIRIWQINQSTKIYSILFVQN